MKKIIGISLIMAFAIASFAQKQKTDPRIDENPNRRPSKTKRGTSEKSPLIAGSALQAQLQNAVDVRKSQVGDEVILTTTQSIKQNGEIVVPKGSSLIGRLTEIQRKSKNNSESKIGMVFDQIKGKNLAAPITASIVSITNVRAASAVGDTLGTDVMGSSSSSGSASTRSSGGGGLLGGVTNTVGGVVNTTTNTVGGVTNTAGQTLGSATQTVGGTLGGIRIAQSSSASANGSTTLSSADKNLRLEKGVMFNLVVNSSVEN